MKHFCLFDRAVLALYMYASDSRIICAVLIFNRWWWHTLCVCLKLFLCNVQYLLKFFKNIKYSRYQQPFILLEFYSNAFDAVDLCNFRLILWLFFYILVIKHFCKDNFCQKNSLNDEPSVYARLLRGCWILKNCT